MSGASVTRVEQVVSPASIPFGTFRGVWGGYIAKVTIAGADYKMSTDIGIRTPCTPCVIEHDQHGFTVATIDTWERDNGRKFTEAG